MGGIGPGAFPVAQIHNPKSKRGRLDFGVWSLDSLDFGFWISDFGFGILQKIIATTRRLGSVDLRCLKIMVAGKSKTAIRVCFQFVVLDRRHIHW